MRIHRPALLVALLGTIAGCAPHKTQSSASANRLRNVITRDEIESSAQREMDLYQAIRSLRPHFLAAPPGVQRASADGAIAVYVDRIRQNGIVALRSITAYSVEEVRYLDPTASQNEFGTIASSGAIMVTMHRPPKDGSSNAERELTRTK
jgi:hypothetical protein